MSSFRTVLTPKPSAHPITLQSPILTLGSCFADTMGQRLIDNKFPTLANPFGVIFNPVSLATLLQQVLDEQLPYEDHYLHHEGLWRHLDLHSDFAHAELTAMERAIHRTWQQTKDFLSTAGWLVLTLGTAHVYTWKATGRIVANCHKVPGAQFEKRRLTVGEIVEPLQRLFATAWQHNPQLRVVLTVSPIRHLRNTLPHNGASKATLRVAVEELAQLYPDRVQYFPAYELVMDDLRDYRFYAEDMLHLTPTAQQYVWDAFAQAYLTDEARTFLSAWGSIRRALQHRPRHPQGAAHQAFVRSTLAQLAQWEGLVDTSAERALLESQLVD